MEKDLDLSRRKTQELSLDKRALEEEVKEANARSRLLEAKLISTIRKMGPGSQRI